MKIKDASLGRRKSQRVSSIFPIEIGIKDPLTGSPSALLGEAVNLSEKGLCLILESSLPDSPYFNLRIDLPPCYSPNPISAQGVEVEVSVVWKKTFARGRQFRYGIIFSECEANRPSLSILKGILSDEAEKLFKPSGVLTERPEISFVRIAHSCNMYAVDLTIGCEHGCLYCHFSKLNEEECRKKYPFIKDFPTKVDMSTMYKQDSFPFSPIYLSPSSDPFAPKARDLTHELLEYLLPKGLVFNISTKDIIPDKTIRLLKRYSSSIEGLVVGVTSLDEKRNKLLEPDCPSAEERLNSVPRLLKIGCRIGVRMDPIFPLIDDTDDALNSTVKAIAKTGVKDITGTYLFSFGRFLRRLKKEPFLQKSLGLLNEKSYIAGGVALSIPLEMKKGMYEKMDAVCRSYGIIFNTCGCKEVRLRDTGYSLICRNPDFIKPAFHQGTAK